MSLIKADSMIKKKEKLIITLNDIVKNIIIHY